MTQNFRCAEVKYFKPGLAVIALVTAHALIFGAGIGAAQEKKTKEFKRSASRGAAISAPEIKLTGVWGDQGGETVFRSPLALARDDRNGDLIVTSFETGEVVILDKSGALLKRLGREAGLKTPYGVAVDTLGSIYVSEVNTGRIKVFSPAGTAVNEIDLTAITGTTVSPGRITIDKDDFLYVVDLNSHRILVLNPKGELILSQGMFEYLQKAGPVGGNRFIGISAQGTTVKIYDKAGKFLTSFGSHTDELQKSFSFPTGFAVDAKGRLWIADAFQHRLKVFSLDGNLLFNFGRPEQKTGGFFFPVDLCFGEAGELFVLEKGANRIQVFQVKDLMQ